MEKDLLEQAAYSLITVTQEYCNTLILEMKNHPKEEGWFQEIKDGIRTLNHVTCALERVCRVLQESKNQQTSCGSTGSHSDRSIGSGTLPSNLSQSQHPVT